MFLGNSGHMDLLSTCSTGPLFGALRKSKQGIGTPWGPVLPVPGCKLGLPSVELLPLRQSKAHDAHGAGLGVRAGAGGGAELEDDSPAIKRSLMLEEGSAQGPSLSHVWLW